MGLLWVSRIFVFSQLFLGVSADCECYYGASQTLNIFNPPQAFVLGAYTDDGTACVPPSLQCIIPMFSGNNSYGLTNFQLTRLPTPTSGVVTVALQNEDGSAVATYDSTMTDWTQFSGQLSRTPTGKVIITYPNVTDQLQVVGSVGSKLGLNTATQRPTTNTPPTVPTYNGGLNLTTNPRLISNDIFFAIDVGRGNGNASDFKDMLTMVNSLINVLSVTVKADSTTGTRISLGQLSPVGGFSVYPSTWELTAANVQSITNTMSPGRATSAYLGAMAGAFSTTQGPFTLKNPTTPADLSYMNTRQTTTRLYIIVTMADPADFDYNTYANEVPNQFRAVDVHPIVLGYKFAGTQLSNLTTNGWSFYNMQGETNDNMQEFINNYLLSGDKTCPVNLGETATGTTVNMNTLPDGHSHNHQSSANYIGPDGDVVGSTVKPWTRNDGSTGRYCNFQNSYWYYSAKPGNSIKFTVYYELEPEKDYLRFYDGNYNEIAAFTGYDVSGSSFTFNGDVRASFVTDEKNVYGGFEIVAENVPNPTTP